MSKLLAAPGRVENEGRGARARRAAPARLAATLPPDSVPNAPPGTTFLLSPPTAPLASLRPSRPLDIAPDKSYPSRSRSAPMSRTHARAPARRRRAHRAFLSSSPIRRSPPECCATLSGARIPRPGSRSESAIVSAARPGTQECSRIPESDGGPRARRTWAQRAAHLRRRPTPRACPKIPFLTFCSAWPVPDGADESSWPTSEIKDVRSLDLSGMRAKPVLSACASGAPLRRSASGSRRAWAMRSCRCGRPGRRRRTCSCPWATRTRAPCATRFLTR